MRLNQLVLGFIASLFCLQTSLQAQTYNSFYGDIVNTVSGANILADLTSYENFGVKNVGSAALTNVENWISSRYQSLGYTVELQEFTYSSGTSNNIIVTKTGTEYPDTYLIIDAHYDSTTNGVGTNDNGSGTVLLMEMARMLKNINTEYSIKFIHFSGEEDGLVGSSYYVNNTVNPENLDIRLVFNIDEVGGVSGMTNDTITCEEDRSNPPSNNAESSAFTASLATLVELYSTLNSEISFAYASDYVPFENNGEIITGFYESNETPYAHGPNDVLANMDPIYLTEVTKAALGATLEFAVSSAQLGVNDYIKNAIRLYPNPIDNGILTVELQDSFQNASLKLFTILGKEVFKKAISSKKQRFNLKSLQSGIYLAVIETNDTRVTKKIIIN